MAKSDGIELLSAERREPGFEVKAMTALLFGSRERAERKAFLVGLLSGDAVFQEPHKDYFLLGDRRAMFARAFQKLRKVLELVEEHSLDPIEERMLKYYAGVAFISLHDNVFLPTLLGMSDDEQLAEWAPMALSYQWIGCYAQTEIAHGSNVRGLRTTCTYLQDSDQLEIHTPDLGAVKWWPGCMGIIRETNGSHKPLPGITVGDIGPKLSTNDNDNGFLRFDRVRIPRRQMLMKHTQLGADGTLSRKGPEKASYATMTRVRASIVMVAGVSLSDAVTIALRFAAVRRQEPGAEPELERPILDYVSVQHLLLPVLADAYALRFVGQHMMQMYQQLERQVRAEDYSLNAIAHATSCALKSYCTTLGADGIIECQRSCGGHAFHQFSGLPELYGKYMPLFTAEGNNWLLTQQTSRFLLKLLHGNSSVAGASYLSPQSRRDLSAASSALSSLAHLSCLHRLAAVFERRCLWLLTSTHAAMQDAASPGGDPFSEDVFLKFLVEHYYISKAHAQATTLRAFINAIEHCSKSHPTPSSNAGSDSSSDFNRGFDFDGRSLVNVLTLLCRLFALSTIDRELGGLLLAGCLDVATAAHIKPTLKSLLAQLRPVAIPLVDAFASTDWELNSALGRWDGDYVGTLYKWAQDNPLNKNQASLGGGPLLPGFEEHLRPIMVAKL